MRSIIFTCAFTLIVFCHAGVSYAQCNNESWTQDDSLKAQALTYLARSRAAVASGNFHQAEIDLQWLYTHAPASSGELYSLGQVVYDTLAELEKKEDRKKVIVDSLILVYDLESKYCDKDNVFAAKVMALYKYNVTRYPKVVLSFFDSLLNQRGNNVSNAVVIAYMRTVKKLFQKEHKLTDDQILGHYNRAMRISEYKQRQARRQRLPEDPYLRLKDDIDAILFSMVVVDCNFVKKNLGPRFRSHPEDLTLARKIISFMSQNQCIDDPLWLDAGERIYSSSEEKEFSLSKSLGLRYFSSNNFIRSESYFKDAVDTAPSDRDKGEMLIYYGRIRARADKAEARKIYLQAIKVDKGNKEAYERIGDLYFNSEADCQQKSNTVDDHLVYLLAAEYYQRSGNDSKVTMARQHFPTKAQIAATGYTNGSEKLVGCWIQEPTTIRSKD